MRALGRIFIALLAASVITASTALVATTPSVAAVPGDFDPADLDPVPVPMHGVEGLWSGRSTPSLNIYVWAIQEAGGRLFVGGNFLRTVEGDGGPTHDQPFLASFDLATGEWQPDCRPDLDGAVNALDVTPDGLLIAGGEFTAVDGVPGTEGLVTLNPVTCAVDTTFQGHVERPWSSKRAVVREVEVHGDDVYIAGNFSHAVGPGGQRTRMYKAARLDSRTGSHDASWRPVVSGSGAWAISVDPANDRAHLSGFFSSVNNTAGTNNMASVSLSSGELSTDGIHTAPFNNPRQHDTYDVLVAGGNVWTAGSEHVLQLLDPTTSQRVGSHTTGQRCDGFDGNRCGYFGGGDYQFADPVGDFVIAGCHCTYSTRFGFDDHWSSFTGRRTTHRNVMAYDASSGRLVEEIEFDLHSHADGSWAAAGDRYGCVYVGGEFHVGGVDHGQSRWLGNIAKFCAPDFVPPDPDPDTTPPTAPTGLTATLVGDDAVLAWNDATDPENGNELVTGVDHYVVIRDGVSIATVSGSTYVDPNAPVGATYRVLAVDGAGNTSGPSNDAVLSDPGGPDTQPPSIPDGVTATSQPNGTIDLTWNPSTDNVAVRNYLVYRNGAYLGWTPDTTYTDPSPGPGTNTYELRAIDTSDNRSPKSTPVTADG